MKRKRFLEKVFIASYLIFVYGSLISGCNFESKFLEYSTTPSPTLTFTEKPPRTPTFTKTLTHTPSPTQTPTFTVTSTPTPFAGNPEMFFSPLKTENKGEIYSLNLVTGEQTFIFDPKIYDLNDIGAIFEISGSPMGTFLVIYVLNQDGTEEVIVFNRKNDEIQRIFKSPKSEHRDPDFFWRADEAVLFFDIYGKRRMTGATNFTFDSFLYEFWLNKDSTAIQSEITDSIYWNLKKIISFKCSNQSIDFDCVIEYEGRHQTPDKNKRIFTNPILSPNGKYIAFVDGIVKVLNDNGEYQYTALQINLFDIEANKFTNISPNDGYAYEFVWSNDSKHIIYRYEPTMLKEFNIFTYNIESGKTVKLTQNVFAFDVQSVGFSAEIDPKLIPTHDPLAYLPTPKPTKNSKYPICKPAYTFSDEEDSKLLGLIDMLGGECTFSDGSVHISINFREIPEYINLNDIGTIDYRILLRSVNQEKDYVVLIEPISGRTEGSLDFLLGAKYGEYNNRSFEYIGDASIEVKVPENQIIVTIPGINIWLDARLGIFSSSSSGEDVMTYGIVKPN